MNNLKTKLKHGDFSNTTPEYARAEICAKVPIEVMKKTLIHRKYTDFKYDGQMWMAHSNIVKEKYKSQPFDIISPDGESKLLIYLEAYINSISEDDVKNMYVNKVLDGGIAYYE